jgi:hypothetical protein
MALKTLGTNATTSLSGFVVGTNDVIAADVASLLTAIKGDPPGWQFWNTVNTSGVPSSVGTNRPQINQAYVQTGLLFIPNRGTLQLKPGDVVAWDSTTGWPIVLSGDAAANGPWTGA